jgi:phosphocarrier protein HPr
MLDRRLRIINPLGLHARAAAKLVRLAASYRSAVTLRQDMTEADAKSILSVLALAAGFGTFVEIVIEGPDEREAMEKIEQLILSGFGEL